MSYSIAVVPLIAAVVVPVPAVGVWYVFILTDNADGVLSCSVYRLSLSGPIK